MGCIQSRQKKYEVDELSREEIGSREARAGPSIEEPKARKSSGESTSKLQVKRGRTKNQEASSSGEKKDAKGKRKIKSPRVYRKSGVADPEDSPKKIMTQMLQKPFSPKKSPKKSSEKNEPKTVPPLLSTKNAAVEVGEDESDQSMSLYETIGQIVKPAVEEGINAVEGTIRSVQGGFMKCSVCSTTRKSKKSQGTLWAQMYNL